VVACGRQAIVLVPEISLTPQTEARFRARFGKVAVLHSHLTDTERPWHWSRSPTAKCMSSWGPAAPSSRRRRSWADRHRRGARDDVQAGDDTALLGSRCGHQRAAAEQVPLVLGSATPSLESWQRAAAGEYRLVEMPRRVMDRPMPQVATIDLKLERQDRQARGALSRPCCGRSNRPSRTMAR